MIGGTIRRTAVLAKAMRGMSRRGIGSTAVARKVYEDVDRAFFEARVLDPAAADAATPVLVDFFATWCQPCKLLSPTLKKVASSPDLVAGKHVDLVTIDVDRYNDIAQAFKVRQIPHRHRHSPSHH
jgi:thioredoxin 1